MSHKDIDARWTNKNNETFYGYKNHIKADTGSKFIDNYEVTSANVNDSNVLEKLVDEKDKGQELHGDSAYSGQDQESTVCKVKMINKIHEKGYKNRALTEEQEANNRIKSTKRA